MVTRELITGVFCLTMLTGWTWPAEENEIQLRGSVGHSLNNMLTDVKGSCWSDGYHWSDMRMAAGPALSGGIEWFAKGWLSLRLEGQYQTHAIKQQVVTSGNAIDGKSPEYMIKGWNGKAVSVRPSMVFHTPAVYGTHLYVGGGPVFTMATLCDGIGCTASDDFGLQGLAGIQADLIGPVAGFVEYRHTQGYMDCYDPEGCWRGRRSGDNVMVGISLRIQWHLLLDGLKRIP